MEQDIKLMRDTYRRSLQISDKNIDWDKVFTKRHYKFYYKYFFIEKILLLLSYFVFSVWLLYNVRIMMSSKYILQYSLLLIYCLLNMLWYVFFIKKILSINILTNKVYEIDKKNAEILLMEKCEFIIEMLILIPICIFLLEPTLYYILDLEVWEDKFIDILTILICIIVDIIYYVFNRKTIDKLYKEINYLNK